MRRIGRINRVHRLHLGFLCGLLGAIGLSSPSQATPQFARENNLRCTSCHIVVPRLNQEGLAFQASGYQLPDGLRQKKEAASEGSRFSTIPLAGWIASRFEDKGSGGPSDLFLPKVELISGGRLGEKWSYFAEWRIVSLSLNSDGTLKDRGGRFEDLFVEWSPKDRHSFKFGQYRTISQVDVSLRLSPSDPLLFKNGLATGTDPDARVESLQRFSPSSRSPSVGYTFRSLRGSRSSDGLFHNITVPFTGELSIPLSSEASQTASFELQGPPKGVFLETFYRRGHKSVGAHAFFDNDAWLLTALGTYDWRSLVFTAGLGTDDRDVGGSRTRSSLEAEYLFTKSNSLRAAAGLRIEDVSDDGKHAAFVPYIAVAGPNTQHTFLLQLQYKSQDGADSFVIDLSALF